MKYLFIFFIVLAFSCSQPNVTQNPTGEPEISFTVNGVNYSYKGDQTLSGVGVFATRIIGSGGVNTVYSFSGYKNTGNLCQFIIITTPPDTLKTQSYRCSFGSGSNLKIDNYVHSFIGSSNYLDFMITGYQNGTVNATFSGVMTKIVNATQTESVTVTNGSIKNVALKY